MKKKGAPSKSESPFITALRYRFPVNEYVLLTQTSMHSGLEFRKADALILGKWSSRDLSIHGFEVKASRADWMLELKNPKKAETGASYCDFWTLFTRPGVADPGEIPISWGHWVLEDGIQVLKEPVSLTPKPVDRSFIASLVESLLAQMSQNVALISAQADYERGFSDGKRKGYDEANEAQGYLMDRVTRQAVELEKLNARLRHFDLDDLNQKQEEAIKKVAEFCTSWEYRKVDPILKALDLLAHETPDELSIRLRKLVVISREIQEHLETRVSALEELSQNSGPPLSA